MKAMSPLCVGCLVKGCDGFLEITVCAQEDSVAQRAALAVRQEMVEHNSKGDSWRGYSDSTNARHAVAHLVGALLLPWQRRHHVRHALARVAMMNARPQVGR